MSWNYRVIKYAEGGYGLHEVYYDSDGEPLSMTEEPAGFVGDSVEELTASLMLARTDVRKRPVLNEDLEEA